MILTTPTTKDISANIVAQLEGSLNQSIPLLPKAFNRVLAKALAGVFMLLYKYAGFMLLQIFIRTASINETLINGKSIKPLIEWGRLIGIGDPIAANNAELSIQVSVQTQTGSLPAGSQLINADNGVTYITMGAVELDASTVTVTIRAVSDQVDGGGAGIVGNLEAGDIVSFANSIPNVARDAVVVSQVVTGADSESVDLYRQRILDRFQKRPQGGAYADYEAWGREAAGIKNIYPYTSPYPGQVDVYVEATPESSGSADGYPTEAQLAAVYDVIQFDTDGLANRRPANALVNVYSIYRTNFVVNITGLTVDDPTQAQADIVSSVQDYFKLKAPFIPGLSILPRMDIISASAISGLIYNVAAEAGGYIVGVEIRRSGIPVGVYTLGAGEKAKSTEINFI